MTGSALVKRLVQIPICRGLTQEEVGQISEIAEEATLANGQRLFREGDAGDALYVVLEGQLEITKQDKSGAQHALATVGDGSVLGEMSLVTGSAARSATASAVGEVKLLEIPADRFARLLSENNVAALKVVHNLAQVMSRRLLSMDEKLVELLDKGKRKEELAEFQRLLQDWSF